jgi:hypothetical protein
MSPQDLRRRAGSQPMATLSTILLLVLPLAICRSAQGDASILEAPQAHALAIQGGVPAGEAGFRELAGQHRSLQQASCYCYCPLGLISGPRVPATLGNVPCPGTTASCLAAFGEPCRADASGASPNTQQQRKPERKPQQRDVKKPTTCAGYRAPAQQGRRLLNAPQQVWVNTAALQDVAVSCQPPTGPPNSVKRARLVPASRGTRAGRLIASMSEGVRIGKPAKQGVIRTKVNPSARKQFTRFNSPQELLRSLDGASVYLGPRPKLPLWCASLSGELMRHEQSCHAVQARHHACGIHCTASSYIASPVSAYVAHCIARSCIFPLRRALQDLERPAAESALPWLRVCMRRHVRWHVQAGQQALCGLGVASHHTSAQVW